MVKKTVYNKLLGGRTAHGTYTCFWGRLDAGYSEHTLVDGWKHFHIHINKKEGKCIKAVRNFHAAVRGRYPFILVGFSRIKDLFVVMQIYNRMYGKEKGTC